MNTEPDVDALERKREQDAERKRRQRARRGKGRIRLSDLYVDPRDKERVVRYVERVNKQREQLGERKQ